MSEKTVFLAGATGAIGSALAPLRELGWHARLRLPQGAMQ